MEKSRSFLRFLNQEDTRQWLVSLLYTYQLCTRHFSRWPTPWSDDDRNYGSGLANGWPLSMSICLHSNLKSNSFKNRDILQSHRSPVFYMAGIHCHRLVSASLGGVWIPSLLQNSLLHQLHLFTIPCRNLSMLPSCRVTTRQALAKTFPWTVPIFYRNAGKALYIKVHFSSPLCLIINKWLEHLNMPQMND